MRSTTVAVCLALAVSSAFAADDAEPIRLFPRSTYAWPFASGPVYGDVAENRWNEPGVLHTRVGSFDLKRGTPALPAELRASATSPYVILQVDPAAYGDGRFDRIRTLLESRGGVLLEAMAVSAHLVHVDPGVAALLRAQDGVLALEPYHPAFKLAPTIGRTPLADPARASADVYRLEAMLFPGENAQSVARALEHLEAVVERTDPDVVFFDLPRHRLAEVARLDAVKAVFESLPNRMHGEETTVTVQTGTWAGGSVPFHDAGILGAGQILMVLDSGLQLDVGDLSDTRTSGGTPGAGHRKVLLYTTAVGGVGDALGCDAGPQGGFTHGHVVAATALGNASDVETAYGPGWRAADALGGSWKLDGVAPRAKLVLYDAQVTPSTLSCADATKNGLLVGTLYLDGVAGSGSLGDGYGRGARIFNFSWGTTGNNTYGVNAQRSDQFLFDHADATLFVSAGNAGLDSNDDHVPDPITISDPATCKSCLVIGASGVVDEPNDGSNEEDRYNASGVGPVGTTSRMAPLLMAPGTDFGNPGLNMGLDSAYGCRSNDNDQSDPVECDVVQSLSSTSFATAAAAGAGLLVRDYFQQGFYPDGTASDPGNAADQVPDISGALLKAVLVTSAQWMQGGEAVGGNTSKDYRFNREQGYGRIQLANALPLSTYAASAPAMIVSDGGLPSGGRVDLAGIPGTIATAGTTQTGTLRIEDGTRELRCALAWTEDAGDALAHDLDLEMVAPSGKVYFGNFFTEDLDGDGKLDPGENCHDRGPFANTLDEEIWSIETNNCGAGNRRDTRNPVEAIFLSPSLSQVEVGDWSVRVIYRTGTGSQRYALSCSGPIATRASVRLDRSAYACTDQVRVTVAETSDPQDPGVTAVEVATRTTVQVLDAQGTVRDSETGLSFTTTGLRFDSGPIYVTDGTAYDPGNGVLDVHHGDDLRVLYADETDGIPDADKVAASGARVDCQVHVSLGGVIWATWGKDAATLVKGGCERDARGLFTFGFPDKFMDAGELINYRVAFESSETVELRDFQATLRCVHADANSPADCPPGSDFCADPERLDNPPCTEMTILDSPQLIALVPPQSAVSANFSIQMAGAIAGTPKVDMLLGITARQSGKTVERRIALRHVLDVDELSTFYSTDFPAGGTELRDFNGNETLENPTTDISDSTRDFLFETRVYGDLTAGGTRNTSLQAPWSFDANDGGFRVGLNNATTDLAGQIVANWGEDKNFNGILDPGEDRDPMNGSLDSNWSTLGGCGWQSRGAQATGGIWHTGTISNAGGCTGECERVDTLSGTAGAKGAWEVLLMPEVQKVHPGLDADGDPTHRLEITNWAWNMAMDLRTQLDTLLWELDTDTRSVTQADLFRDQAVLNFVSGPRGALAGGNAALLGGFPVFAPFTGTSSTNGTAGNNRQGKNNCLFEAGPRQPDSTLGLSRPADDDLDNDGDALIDEFVTPNGPIRNFDLTRLNGPDMRFNTLDDLYGDAGNSFQGALGFRVLEGTQGSQPSPGYGVGMDDMVIEWREVSLAKDATPCATGACATLSFDVTNGFEGVGSLALTVLDPSPWDPVNPVNDCNGDGDFGDPGDDQDCDDDGTQDVTVKATSVAEPSGEIFVLNRVSPGGPQWRGAIAYSVAFDAPGTLYVVPTVNTAVVTARYDDRDDGTGQRCKNDADPARQGALTETTSLPLPPPAVVQVSSVRLQDNGDNDRFADPNETVTMYVTLHNSSGKDQSGVVIRISSNDPNVDCILDPVIAFGMLAAHETRESTEAFAFRVADVARTSADGDLSAAFNVAISGDAFRSSDRAQRITVDLDLNVSGGFLPTTFTEGFEGTGFGTFTTMSLDAGRESLALSDGYRCQYNDPDFPNSNSYGYTYCFLGASLPVNNGYDWHVHGLTSPDGGRAYLGNNSLHWGVHPGAANADTTRLKQLDAIRSFLPVNLGWNGVVPELSFKHQVGLVDCDYVSCNGGGIDRGIVQVQLANSSGQPVGNWRKISPYENLYDSETVDSYTNCLFDPVDDGSTEDDYFDPTDPLRRLGPSSTCAPEFCFTRHGSIAYDAPFSPLFVGHASDGPGLQGSRGPGTWVETKFDLSRWRGRRMRLRFLTTTIEISNAVTMQQSLSWNPIEADDGWYIDDIRVSGALVSPATLTVDTADRTGLPACGPVCTTAAAILAASPPATGAPGQVTELRASDSFVDRCADGILQFRFWEDVNGNGVPGDGEDRLLRSWSEDPTLLQAPAVTTRYALEMRCSSLPSCGASTSTLVTVPCPSTGTARTPFGQAIAFASKAQLSWAFAAPVDVIRGDLAALRAGGGQFTGTVDACLVNDVTASSVNDATAPAAGAGKYYLVRGAGPTGFCNATASWGTGDRDADLAADPNTCP